MQTTFQYQSLHYYDLFLSLSSTTTPFPPCFLSLTVLVTSILNISPYNMLPLTICCSTKYEFIYSTYKRDHSGWFYSLWYTQVPATYFFLDSRATILSFLNRYKRKTKSSGQMAFRSTSAFCEVPYHSTNISWLPWLDTKGERDNWFNYFNKRSIQPDWVVLTKIPIRVIIQ